ncbi:hypothetical protein GQ600_21564 [Phytophthora cactorum]|nr:hypothetical protein GQ600_21564 [Phytophthora cactorum]
MEIETSGSVDASSEHDDADGSDYGQDSDEEECGLADAFKQFEAQVGPLSLNTPMKGSESINGNVDDVKLQTMLEKQQDFVRAARVEKEAAANRTIEEQIALEKTRQLRLDQEALEEIARVEELEKRRQEEERKEIERRELLLKQQLEENDEEEVKIKTLAYSHMREWYQPNKQCFSHRGPCSSGQGIWKLQRVWFCQTCDDCFVSMNQASEEVSILEIQVRSPPPSTDRRLPDNPCPQETTPYITEAQPEWVTGGALTNDKLCDISWVKKIARPSVNPPLLRLDLATSQE